MCACVCVRVLITAYDRVQLAVTSSLSIGCFCVSVFVGGRKGACVHVCMCVCACVCVRVLITAYDRVQLAVTSSLSIGCLCECVCGREKRSMCACVCACPHHGL